MDQANESFPYRCLPLGIANSHGWEMLSPCGFEVEWNGGPGVEDVTVRLDAGAKESEAPVSLFGLGTFTVHVMALMRTPPGWNIHVGGPPNFARDGVAPLSGIIETDWTPYSFTMNWRLTRPNTVVRFEENEPLMHFFPIQRGATEAMNPRFASIEDDQKLKEDFAYWSRSRDAFRREMEDNPPAKPADKWQKFYYRGLMPDGSCPFAEHQIKLQVKEFANPELTGGAPAAMARGVAASEPAPQPAEHAIRQLELRAERAEWMLSTLASQYALSPTANAIVRRDRIDAETFLKEHYAPGRPVVLSGEIADWPALSRWNPDYLRERIGDAQIHYQDQRPDGADYERHKDPYLVSGSFAAFMDRITTQSGNGTYLTAYNSRSNVEALAPLDADVGRIDKLLDHSAGGHGGMIWIGPEGTRTNLHHDPMNIIFAQITGRKRFIMAAATERPNLYNDDYVYSRVLDVTDPDIDLAAFPRLADVTFHEVIVEPGELLYIPIGWWHQVESLDFSVSFTFTNMRWRNDWDRHFPGAP